MPLDSAALRICGTDSAYASPSVMAVNDNFLVAWQDRRNANWDIYAARVSSNGSVFDTTGIPVCLVNGDQQTPRIAASPDGYLIAWTDSRDGGTSRIFAARSLSWGSGVPGFRPEPLNP